MGVIRVKAWRDIMVKIRNEIYFVIKAGFWGEIKAPAGCDIRCMIFLTVNVWDVIFELISFCLAVRFERFLWGTS